MLHARVPHPLFLVATLLFALSVSQCRAEPCRTVYVAPSAHDGDGSARRPFDSIGEALGALRNRRTGLRGVVRFRGGVYRISHTFKLDASDSNVEFQAMAGQAPLISGGDRISGWRPYRDGIFKASAHGLRFRQLYVDGRRAVLARYPNMTSESDMGPYNQVQTWLDKTEQCVLRASDVTPLRHPEGAELVVKKHWDQSIFRIAGLRLDKSYAIVNFQDPEKKTEWHFPFPPRASGQTYFLQNSLDLLDAPGEWYLDEKTDTVFYKPRRGEDMRHVTVIAPVLDELLDVDGAHDVRFVGIGFGYSNWLLPDNRRIGAQSGYRFTDGFSEAVPGGVRVKNCARVDFTDCEFRNMGGTGLELSYGDDQCTIEGCWIHDIASTGIMVYTDTIAPNPPESHQCRQDLIRDCTIYRIGRDYTGAAAINATYPRAITIEHNEVFDCPYVGISVGWGWTHAFTALQDNVIRYNDVHDVMLLHDDAAGIYVMSHQQPTGTGGTKIEDNWVHDIHVSVWAEGNPVAGIYLDNESDGIFVDHNVITNVAQPINMNTPYPNTFSSNASQDPSVIRAAGPLRRRIRVRPSISASRAYPLARPYLSTDSMLRTGESISSENGKYFAILEADGNLAVYPGAAPHPSGPALWQSGTGHGRGLYHAAMQEDANFCLYKVDANGRSTWLWDTRPLGPAGAYFVEVDNDGTLSIYHGSSPFEQGPKAWDSHGYRVAPSKSGTP